MNDENQKPKPQASVPPPRPPRGPRIAAGCADAGDSDQSKKKRKSTERISLPPKPVAKETVRVRQGEE